MFNLDIGHKYPMKYEFISFIGQKKKLSTMSSTCSTVKPNEGDPSDHQETGDNQNNRWRDVSMSLICSRLYSVTDETESNIQHFNIPRTDIENSNAAIPCLSN